MQHRLDQLLQLIFTLFHLQIEHFMFVTITMLKSIFILFCVCQKEDIQVCQNVISDITNAEAETPFSTSHIDWKKTLGCN